MEFNVATRATKLLLQAPRFVPLDPPHGSNVRNKATNHRALRGNSLAATFPCGTVPNGARHQESPHPRGSTVIADTLEISVHYGIVAGAGRQTCEPERIEVERRVDIALQSQDVGRFAKKAALARSHRTGNDKQRFPLHCSSIIPSISALPESGGRAPVFITPAAALHPAIRSRPSSFYSGKSLSLPCRRRDGCSSSARDPARLPLSDLRWRQLSRHPA
jgi:hypothetical protein